MMTSLGRAFAIAGLLVVVVGCAQADTFYVSSSGSDDSTCGSVGSPCQSIRYVLNHHSDQTIFIRTSGFLTGPDNRDLLLEEPRTIIIESNDNNPEENGIDCGGQGRFLSILAKTSDTARHILFIQGLTFRNCIAKADPGKDTTEGGVIRIAVSGRRTDLDYQPRMNVTNCVFHDNKASSGSAISLQGVGSLWTGVVSGRDFHNPNLRIATLDNVIFRGNTHDRGAVYSQAYRIFARKIKFVDIKATLVATMFLEQCMTWFEDVEIARTRSDRFATWWIDHTTADIARLVMNNNFGQGNGAIDCATCAMRLTDCQAANNTAGSGGFWSGSMYSTLEVVRGSFVRNIGNRQGGAFEVGPESTLRIADATLEGNTAGYGGAIHVAWNSMAYISRSRFIGNNANYGGAISGDNAHGLYLTSIEVSDNRARLNGGGLYCARSFINISRVEFLNNVDSGKSASQSVFCSRDYEHMYCKFISDQDFSTICSDAVNYSPYMDKGDGIVDPMWLGLPLWAVVLGGTVIFCIVGVSLFVGIVLLVRRFRRRVDGDGNAVRSPDGSDPHTSLYTNLPTDDLDDDEGLEDS